MTRRTQGTTLFTAILFLVATLVIVQLWLLTVSLEALLGKSYGILVPAASASTLLLLINAGLLRYVIRFDHKIHEGE